MKLGWYLKRLRVMGWRETLHRVGEQLVLLRLKLQQQQNQHYPVPDSSTVAFCSATSPQLPALEWDLNANNQRAEAVLSGHWPALGYDWQWQQADDWHVAPDRGKHWPRSFFGSIPYRQGNPYGDIRVAWEPSRLQQLVSLSLLAADEVTRETAVTLFEQQLLSWVEANPPYLGIHYVSAMECGLRLIAVCHAVDMIRPHLTKPQAIWPAVIKLVDSHARLIVKRLSLYSSAGNHTLAETAGLIYAGVLFPELKQAAHWKAVGLQLFEQETARQFYADGGGIEQAFGYHLFITDLLNLVVRLLASKGEPNAALETIATQANNFLAVMFSDDYQLPAIGDNDGGFALSPFLHISKTLKASGQALTVEVSGQALTGQESISESIRTGTDGQALITFADSGYTVIKDQASPGRMLLFDHGPLGMAPSYGHGHSDCLAVYWREHGEDLLTDPGTFTYTGDPKWRQYFRGVTAHNTVSIDRQDQALQQSAFMWSQPFEAKLVECEQSVDGHRVVLARHNGYRSLGVEHYRGLIYHASGCVLVWDFLVALDDTDASTQLREMSVWWHLAGEVALAPGDSSLISVRGDMGGSLQLELRGGDIYSYCGDEDGPHGWHSPVYGEKVPITTVECRFNGNFPHEFYTYISTDSASITESQQNDFDTIITRLRPLAV